eukprot:evm.model.scf_3692.1 EVM.evm.TU.scf_3692.1   scf_3692:2899-3222(-)
MDLGVCFIQHQEACAASNELPCSSSASVDLAGRDAGGSMAYSTSMCLSSGTAQAPCETAIFHKLSNRRTTAGLYSGSLLPQLNNQKSPCRHCLCCCVPPERPTVLEVS